MSHATSDRDPQRATTVPVSPERQGTTVPSLDLLRQAVDHCGWTYDALAAHFSLKSRGHAHRLLNGEAKIDLQRLDTFPADVLTSFGRLFAESRGWRVHTPNIEQQALSGLLSSLAQVFTVFDRRLNPRQLGQLKGQTNV